MNIAKKLAAVALIASSLLIGGCGEGKIGSVDVNKVMDEAPRVKTLMEEAQGKITEAQNKYEQDRAAKPDMTEEDALKLQNDLQRKLLGINQGTISQIRSRMDIVVAEIAQEKNIDVVINNSDDQRLIFHGAIDITDDVIKKMQ